MDRSHIELARRVFLTKVRSVVTTWVSGCSQTDPVTGVCMIVVSMSS
jgi:hypothetical protein